MLETERLILRAFTKGDFDAHCTIMGKVQLNGHLGPQLSREDLWRRTVGSVGMWSVLGFGSWMALRKCDRRLVGNCGFFDAKRDLIPDFAGTPEMGWIFDPEVHGQGLASEACKAALGWVDGALQPTPIWAIVAPGNAPSFRLAERLGFARLDDSIYAGEPIAVLRRPPTARRPAAR